MQNDLKSRASHELYVVEMDGLKQSDHRVFIEALKRGLELKRQHPWSNVKLRDASDNAPHAIASPPRRTWGIGQANVTEGAISSAHGLRAWVSERANVIGK
jgi:hypothetical protein